MPGRCLKLPLFGRLATLGLVPLACLALLLSPGRAKAGFITSQGVGQDSSNESLSATAQITTGSGTVHIVLTNNVDGANVLSAGQAISGISFTLSSSPGTVSGAGTSGQLISVGANGQVTTTTGSPTRWEQSGHVTTSGDTIQLLALGGSKPSQLILGNPSGGAYSNADSSITQNFSPYVEKTGTFDLNVSGVTANTTITGVTFYFGTTPDSSLTGTLATPEPSGLALAAAGFVALGLTRLLRRHTAGPAR
jgi:hypothetical protein